MELKQAKDLYYRLCRIHTELGVAIKDATHDEEQGYPSHELCAQSGVGDATYHLGKLVIELEKAK